VLQPFLDTTTPLEEAKYAFLGAPLDATASHRSGSRFAPDAIRRASLSMESYSLRSGLDTEDINIADLGNIPVLESVEDLNKIEETLCMIGAGKIPVMMGGEHTVTLASLRALEPDLVVSFDAHMDLRDTLFGVKMSHGTFMRRAMEELDFELVLMGSRAVSREEMDYARAESRVNVVTSRDLSRGEPEAWREALIDRLTVASSVYVTIDMDVVDPASAPAVGNPSPEGIGVSMLLDLIQAVMGVKVVGLDLTEVSPHYDSGLTATQAAYLLLESVYYLERSAL
jgi:agmatinase